MKNIYLKIIPSFIAFTLVGCGVNLKDEAGNKITFKREDVSCWFEDGAYRCRANGVVEDLAGYKYAKSYKDACYFKDVERERKIACVAGLKFGLY
tara:strand:- start:151 stop:435 length:285 start_codon:yes stop_codon:yes gene_type:complete